MERALLSTVLNIQTIRLFGIGLSLGGHQRSVLLHVHNFNIARIKGLEDRPLVSRPRKGFRHRFLHHHVS